MEIVEKAKADFIIKLIPLLLNVVFKFSGFGIFLHFSILPRDLTT